MLKMRALLVVPSTDNAHNEKRHKFFYDGGGGGGNNIFPVGNTTSCPAVVFHVRFQYYTTHIFDWYILMQVCLQLHTDRVGVCACFANVSIKTSRVKVSSDTATFTLSDDQFTFHF